VAEQRYSPLRSRLVLFPPRQSSGLSGNKPSCKVVDIKQAQQGPLYETQDGKRFRPNSMESCLIQNPPATAARYVRFGPFHIDQHRQQVFRNGTPLRLQGKVYQVLILLLQKQGEVVTREELQHALWPAGKHVNYETNTNTTVNKLRQALSESTSKLSYIETMPRRGYRFARTAEFSQIPFATMKPANSPTAETIDPGRDQEAPKRDASRSHKLPTTITVALILAGMLLGATAATYWITHFA
jgi:DNA-binding winged helix-turn-helix (wHTH) protein